MTTSPHQQTMSRHPRNLQVSGDEVASFSSYEQAQAAVNHLSSIGFPVSTVAIVGTDLRQVERVTGRMTWGRALVRGMASGLWLGVFFGVLMTVVAPEGSTTAQMAFTLPVSIFMGIAWGAIVNLISFAMQRGRQEFTSVRDIVAGRYAIMVEYDAHVAKRELRGFPGNLTSARDRIAQRRQARSAQSPQEPTAFGSRLDEQPRYGVRLPQGAPVPSPAASPAHSHGASQSEPSAERIGPAANSAAVDAAFLTERSRPLAGAAPAPTADTASSDTTGDDSVGTDSASTEAPAASSPASVTSAPEASTDSSPSADNSAAPEHSPAEPAADSSEASSADSCEERESHPDHH